MTDLTHGGRITAIPEPETGLLNIAVSDASGPAMTSAVNLTPLEARAIGGAIVAWGLGQAWAAALKAMQRLGHAMAKAADQSERIAP